MKRIVLTLVLCIGCMGFLGAQDNIWKPITCDTPLLGAASNGDLFAMAGYSGLLRSQDEGETWEQVNGNYMHQCIAFSPQGRIFVFPSSYTYLQYSDDGGDTWQQTTIMSSCAMNDIGGIYAVSNDIVVVWSLNGEMYYTLDGGMTWGFGGIEIDEYHQVGDLIVNEAGDVYASKWYYSGEDSGIFHSSLSDMQNWELVAFDGAAIHQMEFDPDGNIVAGALWGSLGGFQHEPGFYLIDGQTIAVSDNGIVYHLRYNYSDYTAVLNYSTDHGEHFFDIGEALPTDNPAPGGGSGASIFKGHDNHLYFHGNGQYYKSVRDADYILNQDNIHYVDAIQICGTDGQTQFPLTVNVENAESGPNYGCLYLQPNPSWFFVKMEEPGDVIININVQSNGRFYDIDFCCWGPFSVLPESSEELTQDKVVDCSYNSSVPITCTIPSEAQTGEYYVLVVTNYANMPGDLSFTIEGGTGSLECPGTHQSEWYYEILNENGSITYQYMYLAGDTIVQDEPTHILVKINTLYDKGLHEEVTHEYVYERDGKLYWWNKTLEMFTVLYDYEAEVGDIWEIKVGTRPIDMHVDAVNYIDYEDVTYRVLHVSDPEGLFSGDIVCGIGHLTSFFPERLMDNGDGIRVEGMRCYWSEGELVFKLGDEDCDAIYEELHGIEEDGPSTGSRILTVYPNPTHGVLFVETQCIASLPATYRITNLMGQTLLIGQITAETQQIDVSNLPDGMYFITFAGETRKFVVR